MKKITFILVAVSIILLFAVGAGATLITAYDIHSEVSYRNVDFSKSYNYTWSEYNFSQVYNKRLILNATAKTSIDTYTNFIYCNVMTVIRGSDQTIKYTQNDEHGTGTLSTPNVTCSTYTAIYTQHFAEIWDQYDELMVLYDIERYST